MNRRPLNAYPRGTAMAGVVEPMTVERVRMMREVASDPDALLEERQLDEILEDSFPASDPPPWTLGVVHADVPSRAERERAIDKVRP